MRAHERRLELHRAPWAPPAGILLGEPIPFGVRELLRGTKLSAAQPSLGIGLWFRIHDAHTLHDQLAESGVVVEDAPHDGRSIERSRSGIPTGTFSPFTTAPDDDHPASARAVLAG